MSSSLVQIYNLAGLRVGHSETLAGPDEKNLFGNLCRILYPIVRDQVLGDFPWRFNKMRVAMAQPAITLPAEWGYAYTIPSDCLKIRAVVTPGNRTPKDDEKVAFERMLDENGEDVIYCDIPDAELIYSKLITDTGRYDASVVSAIAFALGAELATPLKGKPEMAQMMRQAYGLAVSQAAAKSLNEAYDYIPQSSFLTVRG